VKQNTHGWQTFYQDALLESDPEKMLQKVDAAQHAIADRLEDAFHHGQLPMGAATHRRRSALSFLSEEKSGCLTAPS
jgi:hypothetical protein